MVPVYTASALKGCATVEKCGVVSQLMTLDMLVGGMGYVGVGFRRQLWICAGGETAAIGHLNAVMEAYIAKSMHTTAIVHSEVWNALP